MTEPMRYRPMGSDEDVRIIKEIVARASGLAEKHHNPMTQDECECMALAMGAVHATDPMDLKRFNESDDGNFAHDAFGIMRHFNPDTGALEDCFVPRFTI